jgi:hypothetical protein
MEPRRASTPHKRSLARPPWARRLAACVALAVGVLAGLGARAVSPAPYRLIANPACSLTTVDRSFVARAFLKKVRRWPDGAAIEPVDLDQSSPVRRAWSNDVLSRSIEAVRAYWQQMIFSGRGLPPPEMPSDADVVGYVLSRPGAIGYVSAAADLHGARVLQLR